MHRRLIFSWLLVISFSGLALLSLAVMSWRSDHEINCIAATAKGIICPPDSLFSVVFHLNAFKGFSTAVFGQITEAINVLATMLAIGLVAAFIRFSQRSNLGRLNWQLLSDLKSFKPDSQRQAIFWFSLHENSPSFA